MIGKIFIKNFIVTANVGEHTIERNATQSLLLNIAVWADISKSVKSEDINDTVNYVIFKEKITQLVAQKEFVLIETLADTIADICLAEKMAQKVQVRVEKPNKFPGIESVGVEIEKSR
ncbi:MAG: dihydroneopterin aldolase [Patescibacteria group bacterium]